MNDKRVSDHSSGAGMTVGDVYYTLFRQKWKILILCLVGIGVAVGINYTQPPTYTSVAQLYIKYINSDNSTQRITPWTPEVLDVGVQGKLRNEAAILKTLDMSLNVVSNIGAERILKMYGGGGDKNAARTHQAGLPTKPRSRPASISERGRSRVIASSMPMP